MSVLTDSTTTTNDRQQEPARGFDQLADSVDWFEGTWRSWRRRS